MLGDHDAVATIAVSDIKAAGRFYGDTLGLTQVDSMADQMLIYASGTTKLFVYHSQFAATNKATAVTWVVGDDVDRLAGELKAKGVAFEHYDMPQTKREGDIHVAGGTRVAWFTDPDGNILSIVNGGRM